MLRTFDAHPAPPHATCRSEAVLCWQWPRRSFCQACYNYNLTDPNNQTLSSLVDNPTRASVGAAVAGISMHSARTASRSCGAWDQWDGRASTCRATISPTIRNRISVRCRAASSAPRTGTMNTWRSVTRISSSMRPARCRTCRRLKKRSHRGGTDLQGAHVPPHRADAGAVGAPVDVDRRRPPRRRRSSVRTASTPRFCTRWIRHEPISRLGHLPVSPSRSRRATRTSRRRRRSPNSPGG